MPEMICSITSVISLLANASKSATERLHSLNVFHGCSTCQHAWPCFAHFFCAHALNIFSTAQHLQVVDIIWAVCVDFKRHKISVSKLLIVHLQVSIES